MRNFIKFSAKYDDYRGLRIKIAHKKKFDTLILLQYRNYGQFNHFWADYMFFSSSD